MEARATEVKRTIAVVDDHPWIISAVRIMLARLGNYELVLACTGGEKFLDGLSKLPAPQLAIVDLSMPGTDGFAVISWLRKHRPTTRITAFSGFHSTAWVARAIAAGAHCYVQKIDHPKQLAFVLDQLVAHGQYHNELTRASLAADEKRASSLVELNIPEREMRFLRLICEYPGETYAQIGDRMDLSESTMDDCMRRLRDILDVHNRAALVAWALENDLFPDLMVQVGQA